MTDLRATLEAIPAAYDALGAFLLPGSRPPDPERRGRPPIASRRTILNLDVVDLLDTREKADADRNRLDYDLDRRAGARRQGVLPTLSSWVRLVDGELWDFGLEHASPSERPSVASECRFLLAHVNWIDGQGWANQIEDDLSAILRDMRQAAGEMEAEKPKLICLQPGCVWDVVEEKGRETFRCSGCGKQWGRVELHRMAERKRPKTLKQCAVMLNLSERVLRKLLAAKAFKPVARDGNTDMFDIQTVAQASSHIRYREKRAS